MPSRPILQARANTVGPSASRATTIRHFGLGSPRNVFPARPWPRGSRHLQKTRLHASLTLPRGDRGEAVPSVELDSAFFEHLSSPLSFFAHESVELFGRAADRGDPRSLESLGNDRIGVHLGDFTLNLVDDRA